ncbi:MAG TPA: tetratricopeptide repeat protein [Phycisphaerales bacterium]
MGQEPSIVKKAGAAAAGAMLLAAAIIWIPYWPVRLVLGIGAIVFVIVMLRDRALFFMRATGLCLGGAMGVGSFPMIKAGFGLADGTWAGLVVDSSPWVASVLAVVGFGFGVLELIHRKPAAPVRADATPSSPPTGPTSNFHGIAMSSTSLGAATTGSIGTQINNFISQPTLPAAPPPPTSDTRSTVPMPSRTFVPRRNITKKIHEALTKNPEQVVVRQAVTRALGGYGKTVAAILYADQYKEHYPGGRFFLSVESGDLVTSLASLGVALNLPSKNDPKADATAAAHELRVGPASLLILDNVASKESWEAMLTSGLVPRGNCRVLVTTRDEAIDPADAIKVGRLEPAEAREVYRLFCEHRRDKEPDPVKRAALPAALPSDSVADEITAWLGGLAVSVSAVAAYMKLKPHLGWEVYWNGDGKNLRGLKNTPVSELPDVKPGVAAQLGLNMETLPAHRRTLRVLDDALEALPAPERRAVEYAAILPQDLAPAVWLVELLEADAVRRYGPLKLTIPADPDEIRGPAERVLHHLDALDIVLPGGEGGKLLSLHRLWHARVNERGAGEDRSGLLLAIAECAAGRRRVIVGMNSDRTDRGLDNPAALTDQSLRWELTPLVEVCRALWREGQAGQAARIGVWLAGMLRHFGRFSEAAACLSVSSQTDSEVEAANGFGNVAACYGNLAMIQMDQGDLPQARANLEKAIAIQSKHFDPDHPTFATSYSNLAMIQKDQGDLPSARASMERAIAIQSKHFDPDHPTFATSYSNLAMIQQDQGDLAGARASMERAIAIDSKHFGPDHPTFATSYNNLAHICIAEGDRHAARENFKKALGILLKHFDEGHPHVKIVRASMEQIGCGE